MDGTASRTSQMRVTVPQRGDKEDKGKARETYLRDLESANEKIRKLQEENDLLLDAMLSTPPSNSPVNTRRYPSPPSHQYVPPSQNYGPSHAAYGGPPPPPPQPTSAPVYQHPSRLEHPDSIPPPPPPPHSYSYSYPQTQPPRQYQYPPYNSNVRRDI
ncbi:hypothetical protein AGABI2DRAFT_117678 [Agaricus bisporus var. bisporus H97]|uniref:hypothetical protein n=1 Tax=Agaricus bisporus var. bisporus (strain H97 / ATCC MYA-4626 / FGSC 10389) TaxID=936046 RepID=UPI00029F6132|nr:hypothetical protein AGABI2DRAFT_117678 [Agaricus bisporus var. bisporus H97]EKV47096.1 hypothetical protein AGABI2DRAFT_117678 [Agaricus bisporus var. bisporus H97]